MTYIRDKSEYIKHTRGGDLIVLYISRLYHEPVGWSDLCLKYKCIVVDIEQVPDFADRVLIERIPYIAVFSAGRIVGRADSVEQLAL